MFGGMPIPLGGMPIVARSRANPKSVSGLVHWLDASDQSTVFTNKTFGTALSATGPCGGWKDKSGSFADVTATSLDAPVWTTGLQNGKPGMVFDVNNNNCGFDGIVAGIPATDPYTAIVVLNINGNSSLDRVIVGGGVSSNCFSVWVPGATVALGATREYTEDLGAATTPFTSPGIAVGAVSFDHTLAANQVQFWLNGAKNGSTTGHTSGVVTAPTQFGNNWSLAGAKCYIFEWLLYRRVLTDSEMALLFYYLRSKWAAF